MRRFSSTTSTRSRSGPLAIGVDEATDECLTGSRARIRVRVRHILRKHVCLPDLTEEATRTVLEQADVLCGDWAVFGDN
jgi:hypothetical protein